MSSVIPILVFLGISIAVAAFCHSVIRSFMGATIVSAFISTVLYQLAGFVVLGYLDPFFLIAIVVGAFYALLISIPVGFVTRSIRARRPPR
jgi:hypothetical protein